MSSEEDQIKKRFKRLLCEAEKISSFDKVKYKLWFDQVHNFLEILFGENNNYIQKISNQSNIPSYFGYRQRDEYVGNITTILYSAMDDYHIEICRIKQKEKEKKFSEIFTDNSQDDHKTKILFLGANPSGSRLELDEEIKRIQTNFKLAKERDNLELKQEWKVTIDTLMQAILDESPTIVHFSGHGLQEGIILHDESGVPKTVNEEALANLFRLFRDHVKCVVLNSCYSEYQAKAIKNHISYVIKMKSGISDKAAISFSTGFYKAIGAGRDIPFAFEMGVASIKLEGIKAGNIPILL